MTKADKDATKALEPTKEEKELIAAQKELIKAADQATTVVADFLKHAQNGAYSEAAELLTPETRSYFKSDLAAVFGNLKLVLDHITRGGDIRSVTYSSVSVRGEGAHVDAEISYRSGPSERRAFDLIKIQKEWKIALPVGPQAQALVLTAPATTSTLPASPEEGVVARPMPAPTPATDAPEAAPKTAALAPVAASAVVAAAGAPATAATPVPSATPTPAPQLAAATATETLTAAAASEAPAGQSGLPRVSVPAAPAEQAAEALPISVIEAATAGNGETTPTALSDAPWGAVR